MIKLIANSGIQFHTFHLSFDIENDETLSRLRLGFHEYEKDPMSLDPEYVLEYATKVASQNKWFSLDYLREQNCLLENGKVNLNADFEFLLEELNADSCYTLRDIEQVLELFTSEQLDQDSDWLPIPYFKTTEGDASPSAWARMKISPIKSEKRSERCFKVMLAFDTRVVEERQSFVPTYNTLSYGHSEFSLSANVHDNIKFTSNYFVKNYLENVNKGRKHNKFEYRHLASYLYLIKFFAETNQFPVVKLCSDRTERKINVDLVLDIGNANTCGVLFESPANRESFTFDSVEKLKLRNLTDPSQISDKPFDMRMAFTKANLGALEIPEFEGCFHWPSFVRMGPEAKMLINDFGLENSENGALTHHSSPKRYLWDTALSEVPWSDIRTGADISDVKLSRVFKGEIEGGEPRYSKQTLMTFAYVEILMHALVQINSIEFRTKHGRVELPRVLNKVVVTCPTVIPEQEQIILREKAYEAVEVIRKTLGLDTNSIQIVVEPSPSKLKADEDEDKDTWIYDEATCCQLVFLYAELAKRYQDSKLFFDLYGKKRADAVDPQKKSVTIATVDIGGGTTDLMICDYQHNDGNIIQPQPFFWESFNLAGDDLLKAVIQNILIEDINDTSGGKVTAGIIASYARQIGCTSVTQKLNDFFGSNSNLQDFAHRNTYRKNFVVQIAKPIAEMFLKHTASGAEDYTCSFEDLFEGTKPNTELVDYFNQHMSEENINFKLEDTKWNLSKARVNQVVERIFGKLFQELSVLMATYKCDFLLLAGQPTKLDAVKELFVKFLPVMPNRIISLNDEAYRIGRWYPFANANGYCENPKTMVAVGALIAAMGDMKNNNLGNFILDTKYLKKKLTSRAKYIGWMDTRVAAIKDEDLYLTPGKKNARIVVHHLPHTLGYKQLSNTAYTAKPIFEIDFAEAKDAEALRGRMPFKITLRRERNDLETIEIEEVIDADGEDLNLAAFKCKLKTLKDQKEHWLDSGVFSLNI